MNIHYVALTWDQVTFISLFLRRSVLLIADSKMLWECKKLSDICSIHKAPTVLCVRHTFTGNVL